jgi:hypothetical protein
MSVRRWILVLVPSLLVALVGWHRPGADPAVEPAAIVDPGAGTPSNRDPAPWREAAAPVQRVELPVEAHAEPMPSAHSDPEGLAAAAERFPGVFEAAIERLQAAFPGMALPESRQPGQREAAEFVAAYLRVVGEDAAAREVYQNELVDQITTETLARWERVLPPGTDVTALRDAVLAGKHETIRLPPGGHFVMMSGSYMIVPAGHSRSLDWYALASQAAPKEADLRLLVLVSGLR